MTEGKMNSATKSRLETHCSMCGSSLIENKPSRTTEPDGAIRPSRDHVIAATAVKRFQQIVTSYRGPATGFKQYLLNALADMNWNADRILASGFEELLQ